MHGIDLKGVIFFFFRFYLNGTADMMSSPRLFFLYPYKMGQKATVLFS